MCVRVPAVLSQIWASGPQDSTCTTVLGAPSSHDAKLWILLSDAPPVPVTESQAFSCTARGGSRRQASAHGHSKQAETATQGS